MKRSRLAFPGLLLLSACMAPVSAEGDPPLPSRAPERKPITIEALLDSATMAKLMGKPAARVEWLADGKRYLKTKDGKSVAVDAASGAEAPFAAPAPIAAALEKAGIPAKDAETLSGRATSNLSPDGMSALFDHKEDLYVARLDGSQALRLTRTPGDEELASFSPDGKTVAFVRNDDLWVVDVATQTEKALTNGGSATLRHGKHDWVYFEELYDRSWKAYWWSPDSTRIAYFETDSSAVPAFTVANDAPDPQVVERTAYPRPGEPNPTVRLLIAPVDGAASAKTDLGDYAPEDRLLSGVHWWPDSSRLALFVQNRTQTWLDVLSVARDGGKPEKILRDSTPAWIEAPLFRALADGSFLMTSERSGFKQLYRYSAKGELAATLSPDGIEVSAIEEVDEKAGAVYFAATRESALGTDLCSTALTGGAMKRLTAAPGNHAASVSGAYFLDVWSSRTSPTRVTLHEIGKAEALRVVDAAAYPAREEWLWSTDELFEIKTPDGFAMRATLLKPPGFDPHKRYPVWYRTYAGPHAPTIFDRWANGRLYDEVLAQRGILVFQCDVRSASGRSAKSAWACRKQLGIAELDDIRAAVAWLRSQPFVEPARIGIEGHSYGGFITAFAMTHCDLFAAGIAGAPVTDWRDYDSIYTERYMLTPKENAEGYDRTSVVKAAKELRGKLLLLHGLIDDNVHFANSVQFIKGLQAAVKDFDLMVYPEARHGVSGKHYQKLRYDFIVGALAPSGASPTAPASPH